MSSTKPSLQLGKIILKNYKTYKGNVIIELSRDLKKTITVIHGDMGYGKTTILEAIYWCLYGESRFTDAERDESILNTNVINNLKPNDFDETLVEIHLYEEDEIRYKIKRTIEFSKKDESTELIKNLKISGRISKGIDLNEKMIFSYLPRGKDDWVPYNDPIRIQNTIDSIFPKSLSKYFLFDAELLDNFFDVSDEKNIKVKDGIEKISGLPIIETATKHLKKISEDIRKSIKDVDLDPINDEILLLKRKLSAIDTKIEKEDKRQTELKAQINTIESFLRSHNENTIRENQQQIDDIKQDIRNNNKLLNKHTGEMSDWILRSNIRIRLRDPLNKSVEKCNVWEKEGKIPIAVSGLALKNILKGNPPVCICGTHLIEGSAEKQHIKKLLEKNLIDSPIIQNITTGRGYWENIVSEVQSINITLKNLRKTRDEFDTVHRNKSDKKKELEKTYEDINIEDIRTKFQKLRDLRNKEKSSNEEMSRDKFAMEVTGKLLEQKERSYSIQMKKSDKHQSENNRKILADTLEKIFGKYSDDLKDDLRNIVAKKTTGYFLKLVSRKEDFARVQIQENYKTVVLDNNQKSKSLSAGQSCCLALSYIAAIRDTAEKNYFMMIDSPLHNISQEERVDIAKNLPKFLPQTQITLLVQDQEYTGHANKGITGKKIPSVRETLMENNSIWKEYVLKTIEEQKNSSYTVIDEVVL